MEPAARRAVLRDAVLIGIGIIGTLDETIFHQLLHWHHFYDATTNTRIPRTSRLGLITDGIFHIVSTGFLAIGLIGFWRRRAEFLPKRLLWGGILLGIGGFNLYDGTIQHKLLKLHQVREGAHPETPYDVVFIGLAVLTVAAGLWLIRGTPAATAR